MGLCLDLSLSLWSRESNPYDQLGRLRLAPWSGALTCGCSCHGAPLLTVFTAANSTPTARSVSLLRTTQEVWRWVSRRVGEFVSERGRGRGRGSVWSTRRVNDMDPLPLVGYAFGADVTGYPRHRRCPLLPRLALRGYPGARPAGGADIGLWCSESQNQGFLDRGSGSLWIVLIACGFAMLTLIVDGYVGLSG
jgi:hypothetical protein